MESHQDVGKRNPQHAIPPQEHKAVNPSARIAAKVVDAFCVLALIFLPGVLIIYSGLLDTYASMDPMEAQRVFYSLESTTYMQVGFLGSLAFSLLVWGSLWCNQVLLVYLSGGYFGKHLVGQRIVDAKTGAAPSLWQASVRFGVEHAVNIPTFFIFLHVPPRLFLPLISVVLAYQIGHLITLMSATHVPLTDRFAGTKVIKSSHRLIRFPFNQAEDPGNDDILDHTQVPSLPDTM